MPLTITKTPIALPRLVNVTKTAATVTGGAFGDREYTIRGLVTNGTDNPKTAKNATAGITKCISMLPATLGGVGNLCPFADDCALTCLNYTGRGSLPTTMYARLARTIVFQLAREWSLETIARQLTNAQRTADRLEQTLFFRGNMLTDYPWESTGLVGDFPRVRWYDYTKNPKRAGRLRSNYWVTFSRGSSNDAAVSEVLKRGCNVAMVFHNENGKCGWRAHDQTLPANIWIGDNGDDSGHKRAGRSYPVRDGGLTDLREFDPIDKRQGGKCHTPSIIGLRLLAHTREKRQTAIDSGFSIQYPFSDHTLCA